MSPEISANDLRRYAIQNRAGITYRVRRAGQVCVVNTNGIVTVPGLRGRPPYNADEMLAQADEFELKRGEEEPRTLSREQMLELLKPPAGKPASPAQK
ncbi:MAG: hypothetical protein ACE5HL_09855 [Terriglobia bacterium]